MGPIRQMRTIWGCVDSSTAEVMHAQRLMVAQLSIKVNAHLNSVIDVE